MTARRLLALFAFLLLGGSAFAFWLGTPVAVGDGGLVEGALAPFRPGLAGPWETVARIPARSLGRGAIVDLDERGDTLYVLHVDHWVRIVNGRISEVFASKERGSPNWLAAGAAIRAVPGGVIVLDRRRQVVSRWSADGVRGVEHDFRRPGGSSSIIMEGIAADTTGILLAAIRHLPAEGAGQWIVLRGRIGDARFDTIYRSADTAQQGDVHDIPRMTGLGRGEFLIMPALGWRIFATDADGRAGDMRVRANGPRFAVPDSIRISYARILDRLPPSQRASHALPRSFPAIRGVTSLGKEHVIVLIATGAETTQIEVLTRAGVPVGRPWIESETRSTFVANGAVFRVDDEDGFTRIERQRLLLLGAR